jgi:hypothetical protein
MAQEFTIKSEEIESRINSLLPSQGGFGAGVDFSASTMIIPIVDVTETASGSALRQDLQVANGFESTITAGSGTSGTQTIVATTGYYKLIINYGIFADGGATNVDVFLDDGASQKSVFKSQVPNGNVGTSVMGETVIINVFISAGKTLKVSATGAADSRYNIISKQIADVSGNLVNPT